MRWQDSCNLMLMVIFIYRYLQELISKRHVFSKPLLARDRVRKLSGRKYEVGRDIGRAEKRLDCRQGLNWIKVGQNYA